MFNHQKNITHVNTGPYLFPASFLIGPLMGLMGALQRIRKVNRDPRIEGSPTLHESRMSGGRAASARKHADVLVAIEDHDGYSYRTNVIMSCKILLYYQAIILLYCYIIIGMM